ncbi:methionine/alanine import family NSS transporter small subunit [Kocuria palustris]|nr:methionine/alanine import family NSS transporter small subunit [Kocuria palustris]
MSTPALIMMIVAMVMVWGGLVASLLHLRRSPEEQDD